MVEARILLQGVGFMLIVLVSIASFLIVHYFAESICSEVMETIPDSLTKNEQGCPPYVSWVIPLIVSIFIFVLLVPLLVKI